MLEAHLLECQPRDVCQRDRIGRLGFFRGVDDIFKVLERYLRLPINVDDVPEFLQRSENEEGINP